MAEQLQRSVVSDTKPIILKRSCDDHIHSSKKQSKAVKLEKHLPLQNDALVSEFLSSHPEIQEKLPRQNAVLLAKFLSSHPQELKLSHDRLSFSYFNGEGYRMLSDLLLMLNEYTILEILDSETSGLLEMVNVIHGLYFSCSWLISLENILKRDFKSHNDVHSLRQLLLREKMSTGDVDFLKRRVDWMKQQQECELVLKRTVDWKKQKQESELVSEFLCRAESELECAESKLVQILKEKKAVLEARARLNIHYTF